MFPPDFAWGAGTAAYQIEGKQKHEVWELLIKVDELDTLSPTHVQCNVR